MILSQKTSYYIDTMQVKQHSGLAVLALWQQTLRATTAWIVANTVDIAIPVIQAIEVSRQRKALSYLDDRLLEDIGLTRKQAENGFCKRFWQK